jgi:hypothetical protein
MLEQGVVFGLLVLLRLVTGVIVSVSPKSLKSTAFALSGTSALSRALRQKSAARELTRCRRRFL